MDKTVKPISRFRFLARNDFFLSRNQVFNLSLYPLVLYFLAFSCAYVDIVLFVSICGFLDLIFHFGAFWRFAIESKIFQMERIGVQLSLLGHLQDVWLIFCQGSAHFYGEFIQVRVFRGVFFSIFSYFRCYSNWCYTINIGCMRSLFSNSDCKCLSVPARRRKCLWCSNLNSSLVTWRTYPINCAMWWSNGHGRHWLLLWKMEIDGIFMASSFTIRNRS